MNKRAIVALAVSAPLVAAAGMAPAMAATDPSAVVITALDAQYVGPLSSAGKMPKIQVTGEQVSKAFVKMTTYKTVAKVAAATDGEATKKGSVVSAEGYKCTAKSYSLVNPGTAGEYAKVKWNCVFKAADTATEITLTYKQASL